MTTTANVPTVVLVHTISAHAATTTLLTTATIPAAVSVGCHLLGSELLPLKRRTEGRSRTATR